MTQREILALVHHLAGVNIGDEVWCVVGIGNGYSARYGVVRTATASFFSGGLMAVTLDVSSVGKYVMSQDVFQARHQALLSIQERLAADEKAATEDPEADPPESGGTNWTPRGVRTCRVCGCTDNDCSGCIERTGVPCRWVEPDLCSACVDVDDAKAKEPRCD
jgi:hypothetical protein